MIGGSALEMRNGSVNPDSKALIDTSGHDFNNALHPRCPGLRGPGFFGVAVARGAADMTRNFVRVVARGLVGVVLLAQMSIAAYACPGVASALQASRHALVTGTPMAEPAEADTLRMATQAPACDDMAGAMDPTFSSLCAEHCKYGQQSDQGSTVNVPAAALVALYAAPAVPELVPPPRRAAASMSALFAASPPHAILHCVYRI